MLLDIGIIQAISLILISSVKILFTPISMISIGYSFWTTIIITSLGGALGAVVFFFVGKKIMEVLGKFGSKKPKKNFTSGNRRIVRIKNKFGLYGMAFTMGIISVPVASILVVKYFGHHKTAVPVLIFTAIGWSFLVTTISYLIKLGLI